MKTFTYNGELYIRVVPSKRLFSSNMVHEVVNRGDVFAVRVSDSALTIVPGTADVTHSDHHLMPTAAQIAKEMKDENVRASNQTPAVSTNSQTTAATRAHLRELADQLRTCKQAGLW